MHVNQEKMSSISKINHELASSLSMSFSNEICRSAHGSNEISWPSMVSLLHSHSWASSPCTLLCTRWVQLLKQIMRLLHHCLCVQHELCCHSHGSSILSPQTILNQMLGSSLFMSLMVFHELFVHMALINTNHELASSLLFTCASWAPSPCKWL